MEATKYLVHGDFELSIPGAGELLQTTHASSRQNLNVALL
jgi:hypothetical protein